MYGETGLALPEFGLKVGLGDLPEFGLDKGLAESGLVLGIAPICICRIAL